MPQDELGPLAATADAPDRTFCRQARAAYVDLACRAAGLARCVDDLRRWWAEEAERRALYGIAKGDPDYRRILAVCTGRKEAFAKISETPPLMPFFSGQIL